MKIKERAIYAWGRIVDLFKPKKPEIEVEIEEMDEEVPEDVPVEVTESATEAVPMTVPDEVSDPTVPDRMGEEEPIPSRMTDEYKAWMEEQFASESDPSPDDL
ncbi:MAG: hypothetical protein IJG40_05950 [Oscillospiraceae bacterium]|nr:hypothetical protein [Oscillospiraceae bacterium]